MRLLTLTQDGHDLAHPASPVAKRFVEYGQLVERFDVLAIGSQDAIVNLSPSVAVHIVSGSNKLIAFARFVKRAFALVQMRQYQVLSTKDPYYVGLLATLLARRFRIGLEIQIHGFEKFFGLRRLIAHFVMRRADGIRTVSERLRTRLVQEFSVPAERLTVAPIFLDTKRFPFLTRTPSSLFTFLTVGRLVSVKNVALQLRALAHLKKIHPTVRLVVVGDGPLRASLINLAAELDLTSAVAFVGATADVPSFLAQADCFLLTSFAEGYGLAPIEAACTGLPVIMTDVGCAGEMIRDRENGLIIPVNDESALVAAMKRIIEDQPLRAALMINNARIHERLLSQQETFTLYQRAWQRASTGFKA